MCSCHKVQRVLAIVVKYDFFALQIMSLLELMSSNGIIWRSLTECLCITGDSKVL